MIDTRDAILAELTRALVDQLAPERVILFGSRARGDHNPGSDYDLMIVVNGLPPSDNIVRLAVQHVHTNVEFVVDTCERFERRRTDVGTLEYAADHEGLILYARAPVSQARQVRESPNQPPESFDEWRARAQSDFLAMTELARAGTAGFRDAVVFHAHQSVEKLLKATLVLTHTPPPRTHDLVELLAGAPAELRNDLRLNEASRSLQALWLNSRYPGRPMPTSQQVDEAVGWARTVREIVERIVAI